MGDFCLRSEALAEWDMHFTQSQAVVAEAQGLLQGTQSIVCMADLLTLGAFCSLPIISGGLLGAYTTEAEALEALKLSVPDFLFVTDDLEAGSGISLVKQTKSICPDSVALLFLRTETKSLVHDAVEAGADGVMFVSSLGGRGDGDFMGALRTTLSGDIYYPRDVLKAADYANDPKQKLPTDITKKETEVLACLASGSTNKEIAEHLYVSLETVKSHVSAVIGKLGVRNRQAAAVIAVQAGLIAC